MPSPIGREGEGPPGSCEQGEDQTDSLLAWFKKIERPIDLYVDWAFVYQLITMSRQLSLRFATPASAIGEATLSNGDRLFELV